MRLRALTLQQTVSHSGRAKLFQRFCHLGLFRWLAEGETRNLFDPFSASAPQYRHTIALQLVPGNERGSSHASVRMAY